MPFFPLFQSPFPFREKEDREEKKEKIGIQFSNKKREEEIKKNRMNDSVYFLLLLFFQEREMERGKRRKRNIVL